MTNHVHLLITPLAEDGLSKAMQMLGRYYLQYFNFTYHPESGVGDYKKDSLYRKPNPGMLLRAAKKHRIDLGGSIMIGDENSDMQAASKAGSESGATTWLVMPERSCPTSRRTRFTRCATSFAVE